MTVPDAAAMGLPPRVRGMAAAAHPRARLSRLTPAGAGNGTKTPCWNMGCRAYPRGCGEWLPRLLRDTVYAGLPPRVRGMAVPRPVTVRQWWLTPAGAGNGTITGPARPALEGLPPRVRGMVYRQRRRVHSALGLTPAGAGNGTTSTNSNCVCTAYPRGCGEWCSRGHGYAIQQGLPPRVRGMVLAVERHGPLRGLTPAGAGNGKNNAKSTKVLRAYPRGCGEWLVLDNRSGRFNGLPPRVRGMGGNGRKP